MDNFLHAAHIILKLYHFAYLSTQCYFVLSEVSQTYLITQTNVFNRASVSKTTTVLYFKIDVRVGLTQVKVIDQ